MTRSYAPLVLSVWRNEDFTKLNVEAQRLYFLLISQPNIDYCGVVPFMPGRWSKLAKESTPARIRRAATDLESAHFVVLDSETEELWVRSFVKHNAVLTQPNVAKSMRSAYLHIASLKIRQQFYGSLTPAEQAKLPSPYGPDDPKGDGTDDDQTEPLGEGLGEPLDEGHAPTRGTAFKAFDLDLDPDLDPNLKPQPGPSSSTADDDERLPMWALIETARRLSARPAHLEPVADIESWTRKTATRVRMAHQADVTAWLEAEPMLTAADVAQRLSPRQETTLEQMARLDRERAVGA